MIGVLLGTMIATTAAKKIGEAIVENAVPLAATAAVATAGAVASGVVSARKDTEASQAAQLKQLEIQQQRLQLEESKRVQAQMKQEMLNKQTMIRTNALNELYAKFAISCYIAWADGVLSADEKKNLDAVFLDIYNQFSQASDVKKVLLQIYNTPHMNFVQLEKYLRNTSPEAIASFLAVADEIAESDGDVSEEEKICIYKIRKYLTDRTGQNYMGHHLTPGANFDMKCSGCAANMEIEPHNNRAVCPFCGNIKFLNAGSFDHSATRVAVSNPTPQKITFRCPLCNTLLSANASSTKCLCSKCRSAISLHNGVPSVW